ncbi:Hypothetical_protein [Hexamita inflata]|uniref:Hypothetical_protein n=1 Tax=Hexamita inflata TaxID=28002 RepID=A0AA86R8J4_9EUKA|nr:Hypothetical protein HINF_LOCUS60350 [Hexamita inflata]
MPTQQRPNRALTELLADQFHLIRQLTIKKLVLASHGLPFIQINRSVILSQIVSKTAFHRLKQKQTQNQEHFHSRVPTGTTGSGIVPYCWVGWFWQTFNKGCLL